MSPCNLPTLPDGTGYPAGAWPGKLPTVTDGLDEVDDGRWLGPGHREFLAYFVLGLMVTALLYFVAITLEVYL